MNSTSSPSIVTKYVPSSNGFTELLFTVIVICPSNLESISIFTALWCSSWEIESTIPPRIVYFKLSLDDVCGAAWGVGVCTGAAAGAGGGEYVWVGAAILGVAGVVSTCNRPPIIAIIAAAKAIEKITPNLSADVISAIFLGILNI